MELIAVVVRNHRFTLEEINNDFDKFIATLKEIDGMKPDISTLMDSEQQKSSDVTEIKLGGLIIHGTDNRLLSMKLKACEKEADYYDVKLEDDKGITIDLDSFIKTIYMLYSKDFTYNEERTTVLSPMMINTFSNVASWMYYNEYTCNIFRINKKNG